MATVQQSAEVNVPISTAYNQWTQFESYPDFMSGVDEVRQVDDTHLHWKVDIAGVDREFDAVILEQRPDERIVWQSMDGISHAGIVTFEPVSAERTRINLAVDWQPHGVAETVADALNIDEAQIASDMRHFKQLIEERGVEEGGWRGTIEPPSQM